MIQVSLEVAGVAHADVLATLHAGCFAVPWQAAAMIELLVTPGVHATIAQAGDQPAGLVMMRVAADEAEILTIGTLPPWRRLGIAGHLLRAAREQAAQAGALRMFLEVAADDPAAVALYSGQGFAPVGRRRSYYAPGRDALVMARPLAAAG